MKTNFQSESTNNVWNYCFYITFSSWLWYAKAEARAIVTRGGAGQIHTHKNIILLFFFSKCKIETVCTIYLEREFPQLGSVLSLANCTNRWAWVGFHCPAECPRTRIRNNLSCTRGLLILLLFYHTTRWVSSLRVVNNARSVAIMDLEQKSF